MRTYIDVNFLYPTGLQGISFGGGGPFRNGTVDTPQFTVGRRLPEPDYNNFHQCAPMAHELSVLDSSLDRERAACCRPPSNGMPAHGRIGQVCWLLSLNQWAVD